MTTKTARAARGLPHAAPMRPRSPFRDFHNQPRGGAHADRRAIREKIVCEQLRRTRDPLEGTE